MTGKRYFRCNVCNDIHYGMKGPEVCPTCAAKNAYVVIDSKEAKDVLDIKPSSLDADQVMEAWKEFTDGNDFMLNPDKAHVGIVLEGVLNNEKSSGLKLCPCRLRDGTRAKDLELICPCNFKMQDTWKKSGMCWCGLFVKK